MHRLLRLLTLWLIALALPIQGAAAATAMAMPASQASRVSMSQGLASARAVAAMAGMSHDAAPCPQHAGHPAVDKSGCCGDCCGPLAWQAPALAVAPAAEAWLPAPRAAAPVVAPQFLTDGPERPPRTFLA